MNIASGAAATAHPSRPGHISNPQDRVPSHNPDAVSIPGALVITVSDRCARGETVDQSGPVAAESLRQAGWEVATLTVADGEPVLEALRHGVHQGYELVLTTGGTGLSARDLTPEMTLKVIARQIPGIAELLRSEGAKTVPTSVLSRGIAGSAGSAGKTLIVNLAGSPQAVRAGMRILKPILPHAIAQLAGRSEH